MNDLPWGSNARSGNISYFRKTNMKILYNSFGIKLSIEGLTVTPPIFCFSIVYTINSGTRKLWRGGGALLKFFVFCVYQDFARACSLFGCGRQAGGKLHTSWPQTQSPHHDLSPLLAIDGNFFWIIKHVLWSALVEYGRKVWKISFDPRLGSLNTVQAFAG